MDIILYLLIFAAVVLYLLWRLKEQPAEAWLPNELKTARLVGVEKDLVLDGRFKLKGRIDRLYKLEDGRHVPVERKRNRGNGRVYATDILQLSLYGYILRSQGKPVAPFGYVAFPDSNIPSRVTLYDDSEVEKRLIRYGRLKGGEVQPNKAADGKCRSCSHTQSCAV